MKCYACRLLELEAEPKAAAEQNKHPWHIIWKAQGEVNKIPNPVPLNMYLVRNNKTL